MKRNIFLIIFVIFSAIYFYLQDSIRGILLVNKYMWNSRPIIYSVLLASVLITGTLTLISGIKNFQNNKLRFFISLIVILVVSLLYYIFSITFS